MNLRISDFGIAPDSGEDAAIAVQRAIQTASRMNAPVTLEFAKGRYDFYTENAAKAPYYISNTASEQENADVTKTIGLLFKGIKNLIIEGNGSWFIFHGKQTMFVLDECENIEIRNLHTDFERPTMAEMTVVGTGSNYIDIKVHPSTRYVIEDGKLYWIGDGWKFHQGYMQEYDPVQNTTWRIENLGALALKVVELGFLKLRFFFDEVPNTKIGRVLQVRDGLRDQVGAFVTKCRNISWNHISFHYLHGLGLVNQYSENLFFNELSLTPREDLGRTVTAFADFMQFSGCRGKIKVTNCHFIGAHDDAINVHGTHLRIVNKPAPNQLIVRFMHPQSYGFDAFFPGDEINLIREKSLTAFDSHTIVSAKMLNPRDILLTLKKEVQAELEENDLVENVTWNPNVEITNNYFARIPTRGMLITTRGKVEIENNVLEKITMSGILIADDGSSWFESGPVRDVTIRRNRFIECGNEEHPVIYINPENEEVNVDHPVHSNITIEENFIQTHHSILLFAKSTKGLNFQKNTISICEESDTSNDIMITLMGCSEVNISDNTFEGKGNSRCMVIDQMTGSEKSLCPEE